VTGATKSRQFAVSLNSFNGNIMIDSSDADADDDNWSCAKATNLELISVSIVSDIDWSMNEFLDFIY